MEIVNRPIIEFYRDSLSAARNKGFMWAVTLLAREADVDGLYLNLRKSWNSLDSITGKYFLFILAGKETMIGNNCKDSIVIDSRERYFGEYNNYVKFINPNIELEDSYIRYSYYKNLNINTLEESQTMAVNALRDYFSISESDIPCLVFSCLFPSTYGNIVITISGNDIYGYFKGLFNAIEPLLKQHMDVVSQLKKLAKCKKELKTEISQLPLKKEGKILELRTELLLLAEKNIVDNKGRTLHDCINSLEYGKFDRTLRSMLSRYIDWVKNYERNTGRPFNSSSIENAVRQRINAITQAKTKLSRIEQEQDELENTCGKLLSEIEKIIKSSKMDKDTKRDSRVSISMIDGTAQINVALDNSTIEAKQYVGFDKKRLEELLNNVRVALSIDNTDNDIEVVNTNLEIIKDELLGKRKPQKRFLKVALKSLEAIKGTAEFGAAVAALIQFIQPLL